MRVFGERHLLRRKLSAKTRSTHRLAPVETWSWKPFDPVNAALFGDWEGYPYSVETNYRPGRMRQNVVLVFSFGWGTQGLLEAFERNGQRYFFIDFDSFAGEGLIELRETDTSPQTLKLGKAVLDLRDVAAVIWDPPEHMRVTPLASAPPSAYLYFHRWQQFLRDLRGVIRSDAIWLPSHPQNGSTEWQNKFSETSLARKCGLAVPETLCTNDPKAAKKFVRRFRGNVLFREFSRAGSMFPTVFVEASDERDFKTLVKSPCVFQRYVEKEFEVRAVIIGKEVHAVRINSQASPKASIDWRVYDNARVGWERMQLPPKVVASLVRIAAALDIGFGSFDLIKSTDGKYYFLELNRPGATHFLLSYVGLDVPAETAHYLRHRLRDAV